MASGAGIAAYWGNSQPDRLRFGKEERLLHYCSETTVDIILTTSAVGVAGSSIDLGNHCDEVEDEGRAICEDVGNDITACREMGRIVLIAITDEPDDDYEDAVGKFGYFDVDDLNEGYADRLLNTYGDGSDMGTATVPL